MTKQTFLIGGLAVLITACATAPQQTATANLQTNAATTRANTDSPVIASSHSGAQSSHSTQPAPPNASGGAAPGMMTGNATPIDTTKFDEAIARADKESKKKPNDASAKTALGAAYAERAFALTQAAQYRAALGDFRRALKLNPNDAEAKQMHDRIINIFGQMQREVPKEGEEPAPLPFTKES